MSEMISVLDTVFQMLENADRIMELSKRRLRGKEKSVYLFEVTDWQRLHRELKELI